MCPCRPATSLPDGEAKVPHGEEITPSHTELVPEAAPNNDSRLNALC